MRAERKCPRHRCQCQISDCRNSRPRRNSRGRQADRRTCRTDRFHSNISERSPRRRSAGPARRREHQYSAIRLSGAGKRGIHGAQRRRAGADREQVQDDTGIDHANQQPDWDDAAGRPEVIHLAHGIFHAHPTRTRSFSTCSIASISSNATISAREKLPANPPPKINTRVAEIMAWKNGKRVGFGSRQILNSTRWIRLGSPGYVIYSEPDDSHQILEVPPPAAGHWDERRPTWRS